MKAKKFLWVLLSFVLVLSLAAFAACETDTNGDDNNGDNNDPSAVEVTEVSLDKTELSLEVGEEATLVATVKPDDATDKTVTWSTSDSKVASVSGGKVTAVSEGEATITAKAGDKSATCSVTVSDGLVEASVGEWTVDRTEPAAFDVDAEAGTITITTDPAKANGEEGYNYNAYQGKVASVNMPAAAEWKVETSLEVTQDMIDGEVSTSMWLEVTLADGTVVDWSIVHFGKTVSKDSTIDSEAGWDYWNAYDEENGGWVALDEVEPAVGTHDLAIRFADGKINVFIDGTAVASYESTDGENAVTESKVNRIIFQSYCFGNQEADEYTVVWGIPEVSYAPVTVTTAEDFVAAVKASQNGSVIILDGEITLAETLDLSGKSVTIKGTEDSKISVSGNIAVFNMQTGGSTLDGLTIEKTDKTSVDGLIKLGTDGTVKNCTITGQYELGDDEVVRGIVQYAGSQDITVTGNTFTALRQPAYLEGTGTVSGNTVSGTRGFVVTGNSTIVLEDNEFSDNAVDIAIIPNNQTTNNYAGKTVSLSAENNNCFVENQLSKERCKDGETLETYTE